MGAERSFRSRLFAPVDVASLVFFRVAFGALMLRELLWVYYAQGWVERYWIEPTFYFTYYGFGWVAPWPGYGMHLHFWALGALALCILLGLWYRISAALFFLGFTYVFLLDQTQHLNHFYFISLLSLLMVFVPAHRAFSVDARRRPALRSDSAPAWTIGLLRFQIGIVYFFGGVAKLNADWLRGEPMRYHLAQSTDFPLLGRWFTEEWMVYFISYGGLLLDLFVVPFLLWRRTRPLAFAAASAFHLINSRLFTISIFPWLMIAATTLYFSADWPRRLVARWRPGARTREAPVTRAEAGSRVTLALLVAWVAVQTLLPLRYHVYPGDPSWTYEGHRFSWSMMLRSAVTRSRFFATDPVRQATWEVDPLDYLTPAQADKMARTPDMILQFAHHVADELRARGHETIEVRAQVAMSLNGRRPQLLIDPAVDLAAQPRTLMPAPWILPLEVPVTRTIGPGDLEALVPLSAAEVNDLGNALLEQGRPDEAIRHLRRALQLDPSLVEAAYNLGIALASQGELDEAIGHYRRAIEIDPDFAMAHNNLGAVLHSQGKLDEAIGHYREALRLDPRNAEAQNNLGLALGGGKKTR